jgi:hypothetical protein
MSNTRKLSRPGGDREREHRHLGWLNRADNAAILADGARAAYDDEGRGFWFAVKSYATLDETCTTILDGPDLTPLVYVPEARIPRLPAGTDRDVVARMVATYDPAVQVVVVIHDEGRISAYKVRPVQVDPLLN